MASGASPPLTASAMAEATGTPWSDSLRSPVASTLRGAVGAERLGHGVEPSPPKTHSTVSAELLGLGQDLEGDGEDLAVARFGVDPDAGESHVRAP